VESDEIVISAAVSISYRRRRRYWFNRSPAISCKAGLTRRNHIPPKYHFPLWRVSKGRRR